MCTLTYNRKIMNSWAQLYRARKLQLSRLNRMRPSTLKAQLIKECFKGLNFTRRMLCKYAALVHADLYPTN